MKQEGGVWSNQRWRTVRGFFFNWEKMDRIRTEGVKNGARERFGIKGNGDLILLWERQTVRKTKPPPFQFGSQAYFFPINLLSISVALWSFSLLSAPKAELVNKLPHANRLGHHSNTNLPPAGNVFWFFLLLCPLIFTCVWAPFFVWGRLCSAPAVPTRNSVATGQTQQITKSFNLICGAKTTTIFWRCVAAVCQMSLEPQSLDVPRQMLRIWK